MIHTIPSEIIVVISSYLKFVDKFNLMTTCRSLYNLISVSNLHEELNLYGFQMDSIGVIQKFKNHQLNGSQVKHLRIDMNVLDYEHYSVLPTVFPNVTRISEKSGRYGLTQWKTEREKYLPSPMLKWKDKLETYDEVYDWCEIMLTLKYNVFSRLKVLSLGRERHFQNKYEFDGFHLLPYIKNAPALTVLNLSGCNLGFELLQEIHANCPYIKSICLDRVLLMTDNVTLHQPFTQANSMSQLTIKRTVVFDKNGILFDYILRKYPKLQYLHIDLFYGATIRVRLKYIYNNDEDMVSSRLNELESTYKIHKAATSNFLSNLPKTMKVLKLGDEGFKNIIEPLSKSDAGLIELEAKDYFSTTLDIFPTQNEFEYLKTLTSLKTLAIPFDSNLQKYNLDCASNSIIKLTIRLLEDMCYINNVLLLFPSLQKLCIETRHYIMKGNNETSVKAVYPNLQNLRIKCTSDQREMLDFIRTVAPNLNQLDIVYNVEINPNTQPYNVELSDWNLNNCNIDIFLYNYHEGLIICNITIKNATKQFIFKANGSKLSPLESNHHEESLNEVAWANIVCNNVKHVKIGGHSVKVVGDDIIISQ